MDYYIKILKSETQIFCCSAIKVTKQFITRTNKDHLYSNKHDTAEFTTIIFGCKEKH